jgi:hypothetical protein
MLEKNTNRIFDILKKNNIKITGAFHVGANKCEELGFYKELGLQPEDVIWIDAIEDSVIAATHRGIPNVYNAIISDEDDVDVTFNIANNLESSSLLEMKTHLAEHPAVHYVKQIKGKTLTVNSFFKRNSIEHPEKYNFWNFDIQGAELMELKGSTDYIKYIKIINIEVNVKELYKDCALMGEIDNFLAKYGFKRVLTNLTSYGWGDALYIIPENNKILRDITKKYSKTKKLIFNTSRQSIQSKLSKLSRLSKYSKQSKIDKLQKINMKNKFNMKNNANMKHIYIKNDKNIGHKIFDLIFALYLYNLYKGQCIINYVLIKSPQAKANEPKINHIFPKATTKINFISLQDYENININPKLKIYKIHEKDDIMQALETLPSYESLKLHTNIDTNYGLIYKIYETFGLEDKAIFDINNNSNSNDKIMKFNYNNPKQKQLLNDIKNNKDYSVVHIRYGDKLDSLKKYINREKGDVDKLLKSEVDKYLLYTPDYYIDKINYLLTHTKNDTIYIITDTDEVVKEFIMKPTRKFNTNPRVIFLDNLNWLASFYTMIHASYIIMSCSTFSYAGAYFNKKSAKCELLLYHYDTTKDNKSYIPPEEYAISPDWIINDDKKYILNYSYKIGFPILKYVFHWKY